MDYDFGFDLNDPDFQDKMVEKARQDLFNGYLGGLTCVFFESVLSGWPQRIICVVFLLLGYMGNGLDEKHPVLGPLYAFAGAALLPFRTPTSSLFLNLLGRVVGAILLEIIPLMRARVADRSSALVGTCLLQGEPLTALAIMTTFRLSFRLGVLVWILMPATSFWFVPFMQVTLAVLKRLPHPVRRLIVLPLKVFDKCNRYLQYRMFLSFYRFLDRVEYSRLQNADKLILQYPLYRYTPLAKQGQFRVLVVERRRLFHPPRCRLEVEDLDRSSAHIACSYVWGDATRSKTVAIGSFRLDVTESAYSVVRHQQSFFARRRVWIDAICINQFDIKEKAVQIEHMGKIYGHALWVDAYLKFGTEDCDLWILIHDLLNKEIMHQAFTNSDHDLMYQEHLEPYWDRLFDLFASQWFMRMWVMQEIMLAGDLYLYYGQVRLSWPQLRRIVECMDTAVLRAISGARYNLGQQNGRVSDISTPLHLVITRSILKKHRESLFTLLRLFRRQEAADPRDKIYGLMSLAPQDIKDFLGPTYQITLSELLIRTTRYIIEKEGFICLLSCQHRLDRSPATDLPSWVIDWCVVGQSLGQHDVPSWQAATSVQALPVDVQTCSILSRALPVRMMPVIDRVGETTSIIEPAGPVSVESADEFNVEMHRWLTQCRDIVSRSSTSTEPESMQHLKHALYRTLTYDHEDADNETILQFSHPDFQSDIEFLEDWLSIGGDHAKSRIMHEQRRLESMLQSLAKETGRSKRHLRAEFLKGNVQMLKGLKTGAGGDGKDAAQDPRTSSAVQADVFRDSERFMKIVERLRFSFDRRTGVTTSGRVGSFPRSARHGDEICLIAGAPAPFVVRKASAESKSSLESDEKDGDAGEYQVQGYQLVGWCYLHGGMDGNLATGPWTETCLI